MIINRIYEYQKLLSLWLVSFLVGLRTYQHPCTRNKVGPRKTLEAVVVDEDPHIYWSVDFKAVTLLIKVPDNMFRFYLVIINDTLKSNTNYCHVI